MDLPICVEIPELPDPQKLRLPGVTIERHNIMEIVDGLTAPLSPFFSIIDAITAVFKCMEAVQTGNPKEIAECIPELAKKVDVLLSLLPQVSVPLMLIDLIDLLIDTLVQARTQLLHLQQQTKQITGCIDRAKELNDPRLAEIGLCAQNNLLTEAGNVGQSLAALGKLIGLINSFSSMIGGPEIPDLNDLAGSPLDKVIPPIDGLIELLQAARAAVPVP